jgi:acetyl esterase/lipase
MARDWPERKEDMPTIQKEIVYGQGNNRDLKLDIYRPHERENLHTAVLLFHGGAWRMGDKAMMEPFGPELARLGFLAVMPEYRLLGESPWPAQLEDVKAAIRWTRANAESLDIHPDRIVVQGFSAGGHLALMAGGTPEMPAFKGKGGNDTVSDRVAGVIAFFPAIEFTTGPPSPGAIPATYILGETATEEEAKQASPISYVSEAYPPTFLLHGTADQMVPFVTSQRMFDALSERGVAAELHLYPHHTHEFVRLPSMLAPVMSEIALFLKRTVVDPEKYDKENRELNMFARKET